MMKVYCTTRGLNTCGLATPCGDKIARERRGVGIHLLHMIWELATPCGDETARECCGVYVAG
jgi:hypothetical protein